MTADPQLLALVGDLLRDLCDGSVVRASERDAALPGPLLAAVLESELHLVSVSEDAGGAGGTLADAAGVLRLAAGAACPLPLAEQALLGGWLLARAGLAVPAGLLTTAVHADLRTERGRVSGTARRVPWAGAVDEVVALSDDGSRVVMLRTADLELTPGANLAGERRDAVLAEAVLPVAGAPVAPGTADLLRARAAVSRVVLMAGACQAVLRLCVRHAADRTQFGRPINAFQSVAAHLARIAEETALVVAAAELAVLALDTPDALAEAAVAKVVAGESSSAVARAAHQVHGAMGVTAEYDLQLLTRRLWSWRDEHGGEALWSRVVGDRLVAAGPSAAWDVVACPVGLAS